MLNVDRSFPLILVSREYLVYEVIPLHLIVGQFISSVRADLPTLWKHLVCQQRVVQKVSFLLTVLHTSMVYASECLKFCPGLEQVIGCPILGATLFGQVVPSSLNNLWFWARVILPTTISYLLFFPPYWHVMLVCPITTTRKIIGRSSRSMK